MKYRVVITLHVDAFTMAIGGAWEVYDLSGERLTAEVHTAFVSEKTLEGAARHTAWLATQWIEAHPTLF